jgi:hypothetical protein
MPGPAPGSRVVALRAADNPTLPAPRRSDWLVVVICMVVFVTEFGAAFGVIAGLLPFGTSPAVRTETTALPMPGVAEPLEPQPAVNPVAAASPVPLARMALVADWAQLKYVEPVKVAKLRRHRANPARVERTAGHRPDQDALANAIYQPGKRLAGW